MATGKKSNHGAVGVGVAVQRGADVERGHHLGSSRFSSSFLMEKEITQRERAADNVLKEKLRQR
jgi:hypothetical protein